WSGSCRRPSPSPRNRGGPHADEDDGWGSEGAAAPSPRKGHDERDRLAAGPALARLTPAGGCSVPRARASLALALLSLGPDQSRFRGKEAAASRPGGHSTWPIKADILAGRQQSKDA